MNSFEEKFKNLTHKSETSRSYTDEIYPSTEVYFSDLDSVTDPYSVLPEKETEKGATFHSLKDYLSESKEQEKGPFEREDQIKVDAFKSGDNDNLLALVNENGQLKWVFKKLSEVSEISLLIVGNPDDESNYEKFESLNFEEGKWVLLAKMIAALKIPLENIAYALCWGEEDKLPGHVFNLKPKLIMSLGASATNKILEKKERLTTVHGKIFPKSWKSSDGDEISSSVFPLFHPEFLIINPNMKRTAWMDMQNCLEFLQQPPA